MTTQRIDVFARERRSSLNPEFLRAILDYDPLTGIFTWKERGASSFPHLVEFRAIQASKSWNTQLAGRKAGNINSSGHWEICVNLVRYQANRLAWIYMTGKWPQFYIDHINLDCSDNRWVNLREATCSQNQANINKQKRNTSGFKGVSFDKKNGKWKALIQVEKRRIWLGYHQSPEAAGEAYRLAAILAFGEFARP